MKIIVLIFSIYMLALPCLACAETTECTDFSQAQTSQDSNHPEHGDKKEDCGSFCTCSCCVHIVSLNYLSPKIVNENIINRNKLHTFYSNISLPSNYFGNIWQPPKNS